MVGIDSVGEGNHLLDWDLPGEIGFITDEEDLGIGGDLLDLVYPVLLELGETLRVVQRVDEEDCIGVWNRGEGYLGSGFWRWTGIAIARQYPRVGFGRFCR